MSRTLLLIITDGYRSIAAAVGAFLNREQAISIGDKQRIVGDDWRGIDGTLNVIFGKHLLLV